MPQAIRLWRLGADDCRFVIDALVDAGFLAWTAKRTIVRAGRDKAVDSTAGRAHIFVRTRRNADKSVGRGYADGPPTKGVYKGPSAARTELGMSVRVNSEKAPPVGEVVSFTSWGSRDASPPSRGSEDAQQQQQQQ